MFKCGSRCPDHWDLKHELFLYSIQVLKLYAWEVAFGDKVSAIRDKELTYLRSYSLLAGIGSFSWSMATFFVSIPCISSPSSLYLTIAKILMAILISEIYWLFSCTKSQMQYIWIWHNISVSVMCLYLSGNAGYLCYICSSRSPPRCKDSFCGSFPLQHSLLPNKPPASCYIFSRYGRSFSSLCSWYWFPWFIAWCF